MRMIPANSLRITRFHQALVPPELAQFGFDRCVTRTDGRGLSQQNHFKIFCQLSSVPPVGLSQPPSQSVAVMRLSQLLGRHESYSRLSPPPALRTLHFRYTS